MSLRRFCAPGALVAVFAFAIGCGKTENRIIVPTPSPTPSLTPTPVPSPTLAPIAAVASTSGSAVIGAQVTLDGSQSVDPQGGTLAFAWELIARPDGSDAFLAGAETATPTLVPDVVGEYVVRLVVTDTLGIESAPAYVDIAAATCGTAGPVIGALIADNGAPDVGSVVSVHANNLIDPNAACGSLIQPFRYDWSLFSQPAASNAQLSSATAAQPSFVPDVVGAYVLSLTVTDALGNKSAPMFLDVVTSGCGAYLPVAAASVDVSPTVAAGANLVATAASLDNSACSAGFAVTFSYSWSFLSVPAGAHASLSSTVSPSVHLSTDTPGLYTVGVTVTDSKGVQSASAPITFVVGACGAYPPIPAGFTISQSVPTVGGSQTVSDAPVAAGATLFEGGVATSAAGYYVGVPLVVGTTALEDADTTTCALPSQSVAHAWSLLSAPAGSVARLGSATSASAGFTPDLPGAYALSLKTTDSAGYAATSVVTVNASCGGSTPAVGIFQIEQFLPGMTITPPDPMALGYAVGFGATASDPDAIATGPCTVAEDQSPTYHWSLTSQPLGSHATIVGADQLGPSLVPDLTGIYGIEVTITDPQGHSATRVGNFEVACNAAAPALQSSIPGLPDWGATQSVAVNGAHSLLQTRQANPAFDVATLDGSASAAVPFYPGAPVVLAAAAQTSQNVPGCPVFPMSLSYDWRISTQPAGSTAQLNNPTAQNPSFSPDLPGTYEFELTLTDRNTGLSSTTLLGPDASGSPVVSAGSCGTNAPVASVAITAPTATSTFPALEPIGSFVALDASGSSAPDAISYPAGCGLSRPLSYQWALTALPAGSTSALNDAHLVNPSFKPDLAGSYGVKLTVDDGVHAASKTVTVTGVPPRTSSPGASGAVFTATAVDATGNPVVAWWDNTNGTVAAARCTASCGTAAATWASMGTIDSGLSAGLTFAANDEPRPIAIAINGADIWVAYFAGRGGSSTTGAHGGATCSVVLAHGNGSSWVSWQNVPNLRSAVPIGGPPGCTTGGAPNYSNYEFGRWLSMTLVGGRPAVAMWSVFTNTGTELELSTCADTTCSSMSSQLVEGGIGNARIGRWPSVVADAGGFLDLAYFVDDDGAGNSHLRFATNRSGSFATAYIAGPGDVGRFASLVPATGTSQLMVAYRDGIAQNAKMNVCTLGGSSCTFGSAIVVPDAGSSDYGYDMVLASDAAGGPRLAFGESGGAIQLLSATDPTASGGFVTLQTMAGSGPAGLSLTFGSGHSDLAFNGGSSGPVEFVQSN